MDLGPIRNAPRPSDPVVEPRSPWRRFRDWQTADRGELSIRAQVAIGFPSAVIAAGVARLLVGDADSFSSPQAFLAFMVGAVAAGLVLVPVVYRVDRRYPALGLVEPPESDSASTSGSRP